MTKSETRSDYPSIIPEACAPAPVCRLSQQEVDNSIDVRVFRDFEELLPMEQDWDQFICSLNGEIFLSFEWCRAWWKYYGKDRDLFVFIFRVHGEIAAILPLFLEKLRIGLSSIRAVRFVGSDHLPVTLSLPIRPNLTGSVLRCFIAELSRRLKWDVLLIGDISGRSHSFGELLTSFEKTLSKSCSVKAEVTESQTYFYLSDEMDDYIAALKRKPRQEIRRHYKSVEKQNKAVSSNLATTATYDEYFNAFVSMHQAQWRIAGQAGHFIDWPQSLEFHQEISRALLIKDRLRLLRVDIGDECLGYKYAYKFGDSYVSFLGARSGSKETSKISFHKIAFVEQAQKALKENIKIIDSMRGEYRYKLELGGQLLPVRRILVYKRASLARATAFFVSAWLLNAIYLKVWRRRLAPRLGLALGPFLNIWIKSHAFASSCLSIMLDGKP